YVYFFFRESAVEDDSSTYSRVARVCKNDKGGPSTYETEWTSFAKARLNCSVPEKNKPFYFDEIISISNVTSNATNSILYATFVSEFNFLRHSVICAFRLEDIDRLFDRSDYIALDAERHKWVRRKRNEKTQKIGQCANNSRRISEDEALTLRKYPLFADSVPNAFGRAVGIHRGNDHYNQIVVLEGVDIQEGRTDVLYVGTDQGNIIKMVNLVGFSQDEDEDPVVPVAVYELSKLPIRRLLISRNKYLIAVTDPVVYRMPLHFCSTVQQRFAYQDVLLKKTDVCSEERLKIAALNHKDSPIVIPPLTPRNHSGNDGFLPSSDNCVCDSGKLKKDLGEHQRKDCTCSSKNGSLLVTDEPSAVITSEYDEGSNYPWWAWLIVVLALAQTIGLVYLCWKLYARRSAKKHLKQPLSASEVISAYSPTSMMTTSTMSGVSTLSRKTQTPVGFGAPSGTTRSKAKTSKSYGDITIQLEGSAAPSMISVNHVT
ncbi:Semaphorin antigen, partial [Aphelenchoides avenae]